MSMSKQQEKKKSGCTLMTPVKIVGKVIKLPLLIAKVLWAVRSNTPSGFLLDDINFGSVKKEHAANQLEAIRGEIPAGLKGAFVRNGPNPQHAPRGEYHWFDGDGMLHEVHIMEQDGKPTAFYTNRFVQTQKYKAEKKKGRAIWHGIGDLQNPLRALWAIFVMVWEGRDSPLIGTSNTSIEYHAGRFLALNEGENAVQVELPQLDTLGVHRFDGKMAKTDKFTAHPKIDHVTGEMLFFGYYTDTPMVKYHQVSREGKLLKTIPIHLEKSVMMHDFTITENYAIFFNFPLTFDQDRYSQGKPGFMFEVERQGLIGVLRRDAEDASGVQWFDSSLCFMYHVFNSWEDKANNTIVIVGCRSPCPPGFPASGPIPKPEEGTHPRIHRWVCHLDTGRTVETELGHDEIEFPIVNPYRCGRPTRFGWAAGWARPRPGFLGEACKKAGLGYDENPVSSPAVTDRFIKYDLFTGEEMHCIRYPEGFYGGEPLFVPRASKEDVLGGVAAEDDGFIMMYLFNQAKQVSTFAIWDAQSSSEEPLVELALPQRVPYGFHGKWVEQGGIDTQVSHGLHIIPENSLIRRTE